MKPATVPPSGANPAGHDAASPWAMPFSAWKAVVLRSWTEAGNDNVGIVAAGVAFYGFLALVPLLGAIVLSYGLVASPQTVLRNMSGLTAVMPGDAAKLIGEQLMNVVKTSGSKKGLGLVLALALALFGARSGAGSIITALNIAYEEKEKRSFIKVNLLALGITAAAVVVAIFALIAIAALGHLESLIPGAPGFVLVMSKLASYLLLALGGAAAAATLYRYGPSRQKAKWAWLTPGSIFCAAFWLILTLGFGIYVAKFGNYNATYGSLGAVVVLLTWMYLSSYILLFGAELNSELEHQTEKDTTAGAPVPKGERGAWAADHVVGDDAASPEGKTSAVPAEIKPDGRAQQLAPSGASMKADYVASRTSARVLRAAGARKVGMASSALATVGLASLRRKGSAPRGAAILAVAAILSWLSGRHAEADEAP